MKQAASRRGPAALFTLAVAASLAACGMTGSPASSGPRAMAPLQAKGGSQVGGTILFNQQPGGVRVVARVTGLKPNQEHGFHVHEKGDCSAPDAMSAGGHFNPTGQPHGPQATAHHGGDMPSLKADAMGNAEATFTIQGVSLAGATDGVIGKAVIVHAQPDDYTTQPTGNSGGRIACGVIAAVAGS
ncbi:MAG: superoxide dismutase family protein [Pseudomonadota bacterium]